MDYKTSLFTPEQQQIILEISRKELFKDMDYDMLELAIADFWKMCRLQTGASVFVQLPICTRLRVDGGTFKPTVNDELIDITKFVRIKNYIDSKTNVITGALLCIESTGQRATLHVDGLHVEDIKKLMEDAGLKIPYIK